MPSEITLVLRPILFLKLPDSKNSDWNMKKLYKFMNVIYFYNNLPK